MNDLSQEDHDSTSRQERRLTACCCAHLCRSRACRDCSCHSLLVCLVSLIDVLIGHDEVLANLRSHFCSDFLYLEMYSLHTPVGDSELRWLLPI